MRGSVEMPGAVIQMRVYCGGYFPSNAPSFGGVRCVSASLALLLSRVKDGGEGHLCDHRRRTVLRDHIVV